MRLAGLLTETTEYMLPCGVDGHAGGAASCSNSRPRLDADSTERTAKMAWANGAKPVSSPAREASNMLADVSSGIGFGWPLGLTLPTVTTPATGARSRDRQHPQSRAMGDLSHGRPGRGEGPPPTLKPPCSAIRARCIQQRQARPPGPRPRRAGESPPLPIGPAGAVASNV